MSLKIKEKIRDKKEREEKKNLVFKEKIVK